MAILAVLSAAGGAVAQAASSSARPAIVRSSARSSSANKAAAETDAASLLARLNLPAGAVPETAEPAGDDGTLAEPGSGPPATPNLVDEKAWWVVPGTTQQVIQYIDAHPSAGGTSDLSGQSMSSGKPVITSVGFGWPAVAGELGLRWLVVAVVGLQDGSTGVRADSDVVWITPRPRSERIPRATRRVVVSTTRDGKVVQGPFTVVTRAEVARIVSLINALPAFQPGVYACPADFGWQIRVAFYRSAAASSSAPLAVAAIDPNGCGVVQLTLAGKRRPALADGYRATKQLSAVLRIKLDSGRP